MKTLHNYYSNSKQGYLPLFLSDCLDLLDPVLTFDRLMGGIDLNKYLTDIPEYTTGRRRYNPVNMLKTVLFGFMTSGYCSLRELEDNCRVNIRFMYLMDHQTPSYRTFGYFINEILQDQIENIFNDINQAKIINEDYSPAAVLGEIKTQGKEGEFKTTICVTTLYSYIDKGIFLRLTNKNLPVKKNKKRKYNKVDKQQTRAAGTSIEKR